MSNHSKPPGNEDKARNKENKRDRKGGKRERRRHPVLRVIGYTALVIGGVIITGVGAGVGYAAALLKDLPTVTPETFTNLSQPTVVYDRNGKIIGKFSANGDRQPITSINQVSTNLTHAFVAAEDKTFYTNIGINPLAMLRAFVQDLTHHSIQSGASTITQQTVKLAMFPDQQRTMKRKIQEIALAIEVNHILTKDEILTDYMNWVYVGHMGTQDVYGVATASQVLFHKNPSQLNLAEAAFLAAIPNNPTLFSPYQNPNNTIKRQQLILSHMKDDGYITDAQYQEAMSFNIVKDLQKPTTVSQAYPYLMELDVKPQVAQYLVSQGAYPTIQAAEDALPTAGYSVYTTIDLHDQQDVDKVLSDNALFGNTTKTATDANGTVIKDSNGKPVQDLYEAGVTLIDNQTGGILAIGGGRDYYKDYFDHSDIPRQPGSSIKPLLDYAPAIDLHKITAATPILDGPLKFKQVDGSVWAPHDDENYWSGIVSARYALAQSLNVPAIQVLQDITPQAGGKYLEKMGITPNSTTIDGQPTLAASDLDQLSSAIGGLQRGLTVQQMTSAYTTFPNQGVYRQSYLISKITDHSGQPLYQAHPTSTTVFSAQTAYVMDSMLRDVVMNGTATAIGSHFGSNYYIYGKTGTTDQQRDGWFIGYTQNVTMGIWMGYNHHERISTGPGINWYNLKFSIWNRIMDPILKQSPPTQPIAAPPGIVKLDVAKDSGDLPSALSKQANAVYSEIFVQGTEPTATDQVHVNVLYTVYNGKKYLATTNTPPNEIKQGIFLDVSKVALNQPWPLPAGVTTLDSASYVPTAPDPRGGTVLQDPTTSTIPTLAAPSGVQATLNPDNSVTLNWNPVSGATSYTVWRANGPNGPYVSIGGPMTDTSFTDTNIPPLAQAVYYEIYATSDSAISPPSGVVQVQLQSQSSPPSTNTTSGNGVGSTGSGNTVGVISNSVGNSPGNTAGNNTSNSTGTNNSTTNSTSGKSGKKK